MALCEPRKYFSRISRIDIQRDLLQSGLRFVLLDIDNTILTRGEERVVPEDVAAWLEQARAAGVGFCLLSNNWHETPFRIAEQLSMPVVAKAMKPLPKGYREACKLLGAAKGEVAVVGDQISTDIVGANALGLASFLVKPLVEQDLAHTVLIRKIESKILKGRPFDDAC